MLANRIFYEKGYWYLDGVLFCDLHEYRREAGINPELAEDSWHVWNSRTREWEPEPLGGYCEDLLQEFLKSKNGKS